MPRSLVLFGLASLGGGIAAFGRQTAFSARVGFPAAGPDIQAFDNPVGLAGGLAGQAGPHWPLPHLPVRGREDAPSDHNEVTHVQIHHILRLKPKHWYCEESFH